MTSFAQKVNAFNKSLEFAGKLPKSIKVLNPFKENNEILPIANRFYNTYYNDNSIRKLILGINPGRLGAGATGIPFTDSKRLSKICQIEISSFSTHEPSSVFIYEMIDKFGGPQKFYKCFYIHSVCPLGFIEKNNKGNWINCNYYDHEELFNAVQNFIITSLKKQIRFGIDTKTCFVLGKKNAKFFKRINDKEKWFDSIVVLDHPRYIVQYKSKQKDKYISEYLNKLTCF
jgi:Uracil DNA glycosylase superfamily